MYDLHLLGWNGFQQLCLTILRELLGQTVQSFLDTNDGGRDGAFAGVWKTTGGESLQGQFVVQCKFTSRRGYTLSPSDLSDELAKIEKLVACGRCDSYSLMTNAGLSGNQENEIKTLLEKAGVKQVLLLGATWIEQQIRERKRLRMLVPRVYGLGDLSQILDERAYSQARAILESLRDELAKVVVTDAYRKAASAMDQRGFVLLVGEPAAGKTTVASLLAMAAIDQWSAAVLKLEGARNVIEHWNPDEPSQFFWLDDAFGVTQYEQSQALGWNYALPHINSMLRGGAKIVMTSRNYIYNRARQDLKEGAFPLLRESQVVIDVHELTREERQQILYNHLKLGRQPSPFRTEIKPYLAGIAAHERFIPETARRLAEPLFTTGLILGEPNIAQFVEKRERLLQEILQNLDEHSKAALALIFMRNGQLESPVALEPSEEQALSRIGSDVGGCILALQSLNGSLANLTNIATKSVWQFKHPTIADAYAAYLAQNPELLGVFARGSEPEKLIEQVTCGDVGIEKAVVIPGSLFPLIIEKLVALSSRQNNCKNYEALWEAKMALDRFLARRCCQEFLALYLQADPALLPRVSRPGRYLNAVSEVDVAVRLHEFGLLPEEQREAFVETIREHTLEGEDLYALESRDIQSVFHPHEFQQLLNEVHTVLLPKLDDVTFEVTSNHSCSDSAQDYVQPYLDSLRSLRRHFQHDPKATAIVDREVERVKDWIADHPDEDDARPVRRTLGQLGQSDTSHLSRSIFDDIDVE